MQKIDKNKLYVNKNIYFIISPGLSSGVGIRLPGKHGDEN